jgi:hypothetical protein
MAGQTLSIFLSFFILWHLAQALHCAYVPLYPSRLRVRVRDLKRPVLSSKDPIILSSSCLELSHRGDRTDEPSRLKASGALVGMEEYGIGCMMGWKMIGLYHNSRSNRFMRAVIEG